MSNSILTNPESILNNIPIPTFGDDDLNKLKSTMPGDAYTKDSAFSAKLFLKKNFRKFCIFILM